MPSQRSNHQRAFVTRSEAERTGAQTRRAADPTESSPDMLDEQPATADLLQRARNTNVRLTPQEVLHLQRSLGNQQVRRLLAARKPKPARDAQDISTDGPALIQRYDASPEQKVNNLKVLQMKNFWYRAAMSLLEEKNQTDTDLYREYLGFFEFNKAAMNEIKMNPTANLKAMIDEKELEELYPQDLPGQIYGAIAKTFGLKKGETKKALRNYYIRALNSAQDWNPIQKQMAMDNGDTYISKITPVNEGYHETYGPQGKNYGKTGLNSMSTKGRLTDITPEESKRTTNLAHTELKDSKGNLLFSAFRSGALSGKDLKGTANLEATRQNATELFQAMTIKKLQGLSDSDRDQYLRKRFTDKKETLDLDVLSMSLQSSGVMGGEGKHVDLQLAVLNELNGQAMVLELQWQDAHGVAQQNWVSIRPNIIGMNFGVNAQGSKRNQDNDAAIALLGQAIEQYKASSLQAVQALQTLVDAQPMRRGALSVEAMNMIAKIKMIQIKNVKIAQLWTQIQRGKGSVSSYELTSRIANLAFLIDYMVHFNCKSGKDRTGLQDAEAKFLAYRMDKAAKDSTNTDSFFVPLSDSVDADKSDYQRMLFESGNLEMQQYNTGGQGYKIAPGAKALPADMNLMERVGGAEVLKLLQGLQRYTDIDKI